MLPDNLQTGGAVLVVLRVRLQVVNVDVRQPRQEQLQLLLVEDRNQPEKYGFSSQMKVDLVI